MRDQIGFFVTAVIYIAIIYVLVRPGSPGTQLVQTVTGAFADLVRGVAGQTYSTTTGKWSTGTNG
jgi:hypothetical protein